MKGKVVRSKATKNSGDEVFRINETTDSSKFVSKRFIMLKIVSDRARSFGKIKQLVTQGSEVEDRTVGEAPLKTSPDGLSRVMAYSKSKNRFCQGGGDIADDQLIVLVPLGEGGVGNDGGSSHGRTI
ncbi:hypothetical protein C1H46_003207 [Malus baccata]|uniref:Uncharacterized protein n=1 Tax=Malus baccata TaxID=106549 RepID=A0A540NJJ4_MALBA|nr:hypothetical protein C1H46_003207 [Malus baccata]